jgi:CBS domain-containing protein
MPLDDLIQRPIITIATDTSCAEAARIMRDQNIGALVVADEDDAPLGVVTDRDLVARVIAEGKQAPEVTVGEVMSDHPIFLSNQRSLDDAITTMRDLGIRRLPVVDEQGRLEGMLSMDDVLSLISDQLSRLGEAIRTEIRPR